MQAANRFQRALKTRNPTFGAWQMLPGTNHSRAIARSNVDWICVDTEHGNIDDGQMHEAVAAIAATGVSPLVRIAANEAYLVKRALDAGAHGVVVPLIHTPDDARRLVAACKFPPQGTRGFGSPFPPPAFGIASLGQYLQEANEALVTVVQIETREALENVDAIAALPGVDVLLIGPYDLGNALGHPVLDGTFAPPLADAIERIRGACDAHGKRAGFYCTSGAQAREYADRGFGMISIATDVLAIPHFFGEALAAAKGGAVHAAVQAAKGAAARLAGD
ncbi:uncharacterized protein K452DRAFT_295208 [Aplosporella prunicola CBS 121167]|uniref:HpcH/HpaI aldolase/citrate lyase domain-containing protein n=1 Tax=Aplosporella prunicola CBS 121167 TaxID=1176127 RepID=A0A6A6BNB6_9PEZI|nr:uncharacterized protein K452DRAFT_295208 [Aplosporella prunicola CBS 121167]KAF2145602.1 hypothetical protein K452DRAFT_295208 [Aplosporella prunicola CBS 121167]